MKMQIVKYYFSELVQTNQLKISQMWGNSMNAFYQTGGVLEKIFKKNSVTLIDRKSVV